MGFVRGREGKALGGLVFVSRGQMIIRVPDVAHGHGQLLKNPGCPGRLFPCGLGDEYASGISGKHRIQAHNYTARLKDSCARRSQEQNKYRRGLDFFSFSICHI